MRLLSLRLARRVLLFTAGGRWSSQLSPSIRRNLRWFWWDGVFAQASESIVLAYLSIFLLALGATATQIGLTSALSNLSAALLVLPGAAIVERWGRRKQTCLLAGGGIARSMLLLLALLPLVPAAGPVLIYAAMALAVIRAAFANLSVPAWTSLTADIVPLGWRGRYFASRNVAMGVASMAITYFVGWLITRLGSPAGYQWALGLAFASGAVSTGCFAGIQEPASPPRLSSSTTGEKSAPSLARDLRAHPDFLAYCAIAAVWNFSLNVAGPFFSVYLVQDLKASAGFVGALVVVNGLAALPGQRISGLLSDRWGPRRVQLITGLLIPLVPLGWGLSRSPWHVVPIELASGFLWAGYSLASFNFLLALTPEDRRARYSALYQIVVTVTLAAGAAVGGLVATRWGYAATMILSALGRLVAALLFVRFVRPPALAAESR